MDGELDRLRRLYAELDEEHLSDLSKDREGLTTDAQLALGEELQRRGLVPAGRREADAPLATPAGEQPAGTILEERSDSFGVGVPGFFPGAEPAMEQALEPGGEERLGMVSLWTFFDGLELSRACAALDDADIDPAIEEIAGDPTTGTASRFELWVSAADVEPARAMLRRTMGLFPLGELDERDAAEEDPADPERVVAEFDTQAEAEEVRAMLTHAGFTVMVTDALRDGKASVLVEPADYDRALVWLTERLELD